jgi:CBS domain-containing protein
MSEQAWVIVPFQPAFQIAWCIMRKLRHVIFEQHPVALNRSATVVEACREMQRTSAGSVVVVDDDGRLLGIFTARDAVRRVLAVGRDAATTNLGDVVTSNPATLLPDQTAIDALRLMWDGGFRHAPVVKDGRILGVVSRGDFLGVELTRHDEEREFWQHLR